MSWGPLVTHIIVYLLFLLGLVVLIRRWEPLHVLLFFATGLVGYWIEKTNDLRQPFTAVFYPQPHILSFPGTGIPVSIVLGWAGCAVLIRYLSDLAAPRLATSMSSLVGKVVRHGLLLAAISFGFGFAIELLGTGLGAWVYRIPEGPLPFPIGWGPGVWLVLMLVMNAVAQLLTGAISLLCALKHPSGEETGGEP
jgi:hypothetical protein